MCDVGHRALFGLAAGCGCWRIELRPEKEGVMRGEHLECRFCGSVNLRKFIGDMSLRSPGLENSARISKLRKAFAVESMKPPGLYGDFSGGGGGTRCIISLFAEPIS